MCRKARLVAEHTGRGSHFSNLPNSVIPAHDITPHGPNPYPNPIHVWLFVRLRGQHGHFQCHEIVQVD